MEELAAGLLAEVQAAEAVDRGPRKSWSNQNVTVLRNSYKKLLSEYPCLHGYWIRYAETEFRLGNTDLALKIYQDALSGPLQYSSPLWAAYLKFYTILSSSKSSSDARKEFERGLAAVGNQFLSHDFWQAYIDWYEAIDDPYGAIEPLLHILTHTTIHQFAKFYGQLVRLAREAPLNYFSQLETSAEQSEDFRRADIIGKLMELFRRQQKRVASLWVHEKKIHRQYFNPLRPLPPVELDHWRSLAKVSTDVQQVYARALIPAAMSDGLWLSYARWLLQNDPDNLTTALSKASNRLIAVKLYLALWLEHTGHQDQARSVYDQLTPSNSAQLAVNLARFVVRTHQDSVKILEETLERGTDDDILVLAELSKSKPTAFQDYSGSKDDAKYWRAFLKARPDLADQIWDDAPEGYITDEYLELMSRTNIARYVELDRELHRSAFC